jgi:NADP-dependent 3-hydroxy acid dehydrogenase YdfG
MQTAFFDDRAEQYKPPPGASLADPADVAAAVVWVLGRPPAIEVKELAIMSPAEASWP